MAATNPRNTVSMYAQAPLECDPSKIELHKEPEHPIPICRKPITKEEYLAFMETIRGEEMFDRLPMASWAYEEFPEFAMKPEQLTGINADFTEKLTKAKEIGDLDAEKEALEEKVRRLKRMARKNKAIKIAKQRILEIEARRAELEDTEDHDIVINDA